MPFLIGAAGLVPPAGTETRDPPTRRRRHGIPLLGSSESSRGVEGTGSSWRATDFFIGLETVSSQTADRRRYLLTDPNRYSTNAACSARKKVLQTMEACSSDLAGLHASIVNSADYSAEARTKS